MLATTIHKSNTTPHHQSRATTRPPTTHSGQGTNGLVVSKPNSVSGKVFHHRLDHSKPVPAKRLLCTKPGATTAHQLLTAHTPTAGVFFVVLLRKEVIQPHLPVRLPCYDFVPIADPTFDGSLPQGVRPPASGVTDFHDVTGGVYKARERIHRSVADLRLLATPTSWGRVADPNPN